MSDCNDGPLVDMGGFLELETVMNNESAFENERKITDESVSPHKKMNEFKPEYNAKRLVGQEKSDLQTEGDWKRSLPSLATHQKCRSSTLIVSKNASNGQIPSDKYTCRVCKSCFLSKVDLRDHNISAHSTEKHSSCSFCESSFDNVLDFREHLRNHSVMKFISTKQVGLNMFNCTVASEHCNSSTKRSIAMDDNVNAPRCDNCEMTCTSLKDLKRHVKLHRQEVAQCSICGKTFTEKHTLNQHLKLHSGSRPFKCETCDLAFTRASHLKQHRNTHFGLRAYECATCAKRFTLKSSLIRHMTTHRLSSDDRRFMCEVCGKAFKQSATLKSHTFVHSDGAKPFVCDACGKRFARKGSLQVHALSHTGVRVFACGLCSKTFTTNGKLTIHMRNHTGSRPYSCEKCERTFNQSSALKQHSWTHSGFRPLQCPLCCKGFIRKIRLTDHLKQCRK